MAGRPWGRALSVVLLVLVWVPAGAPVVPGPQFLDRDRLVIRLDRLTPAGTWRVEIGNPGPAAEAQVWLIGGVSDVLAVRGGGRIRLAAAGKGTVLLVPGPRRRAATGQLVLISQAGIDRRPVAVTPAPSPLERYWPGLLAAVSVILLATVWLLRRRRRKQAAIGETTPAQGRAGPGESRGFTHSDEPVKEDALNRREYAEHLAELARSATPPMVIGVFGEWGSGKTSMLLQVRALLEDDPECALAWFDPWRHQYDENPVLPLLHAIVTDLELEGRENVIRALRTVSQVLGSLVLSSTVKINLSDVQGALKAYDEENFRLRSERTRLNDHLGRLVATALRERNRSRLVVFIDDLDRCHVDQITALLEALKLHFNRDNCVFVLGVAKAPLVAALKEKYQDPLGEYLDKIVQFPFEMPRLSADAFASYLDGLLNHDIQAAKSLLACGLRANPRAIKRFVNVLVLQDRVARARRLDPYEVRVLAAVLLVRDGDADFYARLMSDPTLLKRVAEDLETAGEEQRPDWPALPLRVVGELAASRTSVPDSVSAYIDLVRESPAPQSGDLVDPVPPREQPQVSEDTVPEESRLSRDALDDALTTLAERVRRRAGGVAGEERALLTPLVRFPEETEARPAPIEDILAQGTRLLISGRQGAGKSVLAARLARRRNEAGDPGAGVAVLLPFRALRSDIAEFDRRLTHALVGEYQIPIADANAVVQRGSLVLVLDGLEEIGDADREAIVTRLVRWADLAGAGVIMTDRRPARARPGFRVLTVEGVVPEEGRHLLHRVLGEHGADPGRLLNLTDALLGSPQLLSALTGDPAWIDDLPDRPVDFLPWFAGWATRRTAEAGFGADAVATALSGVAGLLAETGQEIFSSDDPDVRTVFRRSGIKGMEVPSLLHAAVVAGLLRQAGPQAYHFVHPRLVDRLARSED
ncbi:P-loop NTPase fold protein [Nonomuraea sp. MCN248]|uniref:P-loop NTPase fold protein n=1 Tax=Nonomuraea corallina TaxID=2989783 RepID=A0ABT4S7N6_9ACTN|nr:P-loop NTPase fold protein [Nonomuraea corallina]MDA0633233.1 P-loop NTPase fold protein [Nonomuraea corallina]